MLLQSTEQEATGIRTLTLSITVHLPNHYTAFIWELLFNLVGCFIPGRRQDVAESTPVSIEVDEHKLIVTCRAEMEDTCIIL